MSIVTIKEDDDSILVASCSSIVKICVVFHPFDGGHWVPSKTFSRLLCRLDIMIQDDRQCQ